MSRPLYLDTARLGLMSPNAQQTQIAFARLAGDPDFLLYFSELLRHGADAWPSRLRHRYPELQCWGGLPSLGDSIRGLVGANPSWEVAFASRSLSLWRMAAAHVANHCRRVLTVDLLWSPYRRALVQACQQEGTEITVCRWRPEALGDRDNSGQLGERLVEAYRRYDCDGLALPLVSHLGVALPIQAMVQRLTTLGCAPNAAIVDGSQALGHTPVEFTPLGCDALIGGTHKWIGSGLPLGIGIFGPQVIGSLPPSALHADPLLRLTQEHAGRLVTRHGETANLGPLLAAAGALADLQDRPVADRLEARRRNRQAFQQLIAGLPNWRAWRTTTDRNGILVTRWLMRMPPSERRAALAANGVVASVYASGLVRWSMPDRPLTEHQLALLSQTLRPANPHSWRRLPMAWQPPESPPCPTVELPPANEVEATTSKKAKLAWKVSIESTSA